MDAPKKILLVEDAPQVAGILISKLRREGHQVRWLRTGRGALDALEGAGFDLAVLSTYLLPEKNAWEVLAEIRTKHPGLPVAMMLETEEAPLAWKAAGAGACGVIQKPFKPSGVALQVRGWLAESA